ncbi:SH3 domain-containing protein [Acuticoccus sp. I52.16.1]|uniref:SH3 domain-containing protein n=1 Tax=Acuticoccus sp. I52.16.1 TaxID=2928472 RepID=UPI001FD175A9|nr:SH3 domain-containing protein [Acuticoccus sp. I52.16.1]UOM35960.1 SH3 domain-containing protein [Acuticoccus sp. I52.16.1]
MKPIRFTIASLALILAVVAGAAPPAHAAGPTEMGPSGLPLPRFVSLSANKVNVRVGPSRSYKIKWTFNKRGLPVEIVREYGNWRRVRDVDGEDGWIHRSLLSGKRTALVAPWSETETIPLLETASAASSPVAYLEPFVLADVERCDGSWCSISGQNWHGLVPQRTLWGVYPTEKVD